MSDSSLSDSGLQGTSPRGDVNAFLDGLNNHVFWPVGRQENVTLPSAAAKAADENSAPQGATPQEAPSPSPAPSGPGPGSGSADETGAQSSGSREGMPSSNPAPAGSSDLANWVGVGILAALFFLLVFAFIRKRSQRRKELQEATSQKQALGAKKERIELRETEQPSTAAKVETPAPVRRERPQEKLEETLADVEARRAEEAAEDARLMAKRLLEKARESGDLEAARKAEEAKQIALKAREEAEGLKLKALDEERRRHEEEEEKKRAEYRSRKAQEIEEKELRRQEAERKRKEEAELARQKELEEEAERKKAEEAERKRIEAQAGKTLAEGLAKTRGGFIAGLNAFLGRNKVLDESVLADLEDIFFSADIGVKTATSLLDFARNKVRSKDLADPEKLKKAIREEVLRIITVEADVPAIDSKKPFVTMVVGVNGSGKTTTIGKLAAKISASGKKTLLAAGDTFRAAAAEQLEIWGQRSNVPVVKGKEGGDPGAVIFDAVKRAAAEDYDVLIADTAGRLHTKAPLMEELKRIKRIMEKALPGAPHETLLVLDSTNGQNAIAQAREFHAALGVNGLVLTKLDGTAKGGVIIGICDELKVPVRYVGIGEGVGDLKPFDAKDFVDALFETES